MNKYALICGFSVLCFANAPAYAADWLILIYCAANNDLYPYAQRNIEELQLYGSNNNANVIVQLTRPGGATARYLVCKGHSRLLASLGHVDSGSSDSLKSFLIYGIKNFPACKRALIIWDHGTGYVDAGGVFAKRSICYDQTHNSWINSPNLLNAFKAAYQCTNCTFDIIALDACLMQMLEMETLLAPYATFIVASEEEVPDPGFNYATMLKPFKDGTVSAENFAKQMVYDYRTKYKDTHENYTLSAVDIEKMWLLERNCNTVAKLLICCLKTQIDSSVAATLIRCLLADDCLHFSIFAYIDMARWYQVVLANMAHFKVTNCALKILLANALRQGLELRASAVVANTAGNADAKALGISICFPFDQMPPSYARSPFACCNAWIPFIEYYLSFIAIL